MTVTLFPFVAKQPAIHPGMSRNPDHWVTSLTRSELSAVRKAGPAGPRKERGVSDDRSDQGESVDLYARRRAYDSVRTALRDGTDPQLRRVRALDLACAVLTESGVDGLAEVAIELSLKLAATFERIGTEQGLAAVDLAELWFAD